MLVLLRRKVQDSLQLMGADAAKRDERQKPRYEIVFIKSVS
jgi:hypothetical protein